MARSVESLTEAQIEQIIKAFRTNSQLHNCVYLDNQNKRLKKFLDRATGRDFEVNGREISELKVEADPDDIPF